MKECFSQIPISLKKEKLILAIEETTSASERRVFLRPFHALRQPVQVAGCRRAFFYLLKGAGDHEFEICLPRLWDSLGI